jgi:CheY-like chemotaxis protein
VPGSGLGLVISKQLVEAMQGRLEVHDGANGGCRFEVWLPANAAGLAGSQAEVPDTAEATAADPLECDTALPLLLCVEDNPVNALFLKEAVAVLGGCRVLFARDGEAGLELVRQHRPNLMLSDINLPRMDGVTLVRAIRADPRLRSVKCIALSGDATAEARERALAAGFNDYWTKPLHLGLLADEVRRMERSQV